MDAYPEDYVKHNLPLVLLSGLEADSEDGSSSSVEYPLIHERGHKIFSDFPVLSGAVAEDLRSVLLENDGSSMPWRAGLGTNGNSAAPHIAYRIKSTGRVCAYTLAGKDPREVHANSPLVLSTSPAEGRPSLKFIS